MLNMRWSVYDGNCKLSISPQAVWNDVPSCSVNYVALAVGNNLPGAGASRRGIPGGHLPQCDTGYHAILNEWVYCAKTGITSK